MIWKIIFIMALALAVAGIPMLFIHPIGWGMVAGGAYLAFLNVDNAANANSKGNLQKAAKKLKDIGKFSPVPKPISQYDDWQKQLETFGFLFVEDVRLASEKNAVVRLMCDEERKIWAVLRKSFGRIIVTFYSFGVDGGAVCISNSLIPGVLGTGRAVQEKHPKMSLKELVKLAQDKSFDLECKFPYGLPASVIPFPSPAEFLRLLDEFKLRRSIAFNSYDRNMLAAWGIAPNEAEYLLKLRAVNRDEYWGYLPELPTLRLYPAEDRAVRSHLGGLPDLPPGTEWPKTPEGQAMNFIAQIDCAELPRDKSLPVLPEQGWLLFFSAQEGDKNYSGLKPGDHVGWKVMFFESTVDLKRRNAPEGLFVFKEFSISGKLEKTTLGGHSYAEHDPAASYHLMFGYPDAIQSDNMPEDCADVTQTLYPNKPDDWLLLLQADTDQAHSDLQFGDMGTLFFWIRKEDLAARRFDRTWLIMECY